MIATQSSSIQSAVLQQHRGGRGSQDDVVGTEPCVRFAIKLFVEQRRTLPQGTLLSQLRVVDSLGHSPSRASRLQATQFLLDFCNQE